MRKLLSILGLVLSCVLTQSAAVNWTNYVPNIQVATNANVANQLQLGTTFTDGHLWPSAPDGTPNYILKTTSDHTTGNIFEIWEHTDRVMAIDWAWMLYVPDITLTGDAYVQGTVRANNLVVTNTASVNTIAATNFFPGLLATLDTTNFVIDAGSHTISYPEIQAAGHINFQNVTNGPGAVSVTIYPMGSDRIVSCPTNWIWLSTNNFTLVGTMWAATIPAGKVGYLAVKKRSNGSDQTNIISNFLFTP